MKTLKIIQTLSKVGRVISKVVFILSIVGACGCLVGITIMTAFGIAAPELLNEAFKFAEDTDVNFETSITAMVVGFAYCLAEVFIAKLAENYFTHELEAGTPFTHPLAKEMRKFGISYLIIAIVTEVVCAIGVAIARVIVPTIADIDADSLVSISLALTFIIVSLLCDYGADLKDGTLEAEVVEESKE